ncbi:hypothetical protein GCM10009801_73130 [Streptomyces albiaxialis]|uniref:Uncharacterized protein n=1 Tax=Streptomyces albiaxialis TaxID=329523 RepID=A0ABP5ILU1_9ACTN
MSEDLPHLRVETWHQAVPPAAVPVPAAHVAELHRARAIASLPGIGLLHDLRVLGEARRDADGTDRLDLVPELDYWRTRITPERPVIPRRVDVDRVWIEHRLDYEPDEDQEQRPVPPPGDAGALLRRLAPGPDQPGARTPVPARTVAHLHGRRIIQATPLGFAWDLRAVSEPYDTDGEIVLNLTSAYDYHRLLLTGQAPDDLTPCPLYLLWTE